MFCNIYNLTYIDKYLQKRYIYIDNRLLYFGVIFTKKIRNIICVCVIALLMPILFISVTILVDSYVKPDEVPSFFGWKPFIVLSGSMETEISAGDIVVVKEVDLNSLKINDIIAFNEDDIVITHRIVDIISDGGEVKYITKGDNNKENDKNYVLPSQVEGIYKFRLYGIGNFAMFLQNPIGLVVCLSIPVLLLILVQSFDSKNSKKSLEDAERKAKELEAEIARLKGNK